MPYDAAMRVLHLTDSFGDRGGAYRHLLGVVEGLRTRGVDAQIAAGRRDRGASESSCRITLVPGLEERADEGATIPEESVIDALERLVAKLQPNVLHVHTVMRPRVLAWAADHGAILTVQDHRVFCPGRGKWTASAERCQVVMSEEACAACFEDQSYFRATLEVTAMRLAAVRRMRQILVLSRYMARELTAVGVPGERITVVPPFVHGLDPEAEAEPFGPCVLFVGRLVAAKGVAVAVEAWRRSGLVMPLVFAGTGPLRTTLVSEGFDVRGWLGRGELSRLLRRTSVLVLPSLWEEPFGIAGLEALALGVPVAAFDSGGVGEWHPGEGLVPWGDLDALAGALKRLAGTRAAPRPGFEEGPLMDRLLAEYRNVASISNSMPD
jgi:glycosyltransferase involved in cell wall biosynthesis